MKVKRESDTISSQIAMLHDGLHMRMVILCIGRDRTNIMTSQRGCKVVV